MHFRDLVAGCSESHLAALLRVSVKTFRRWKEGRSRAPHSAALVLHLYLGGDFSALWGADWGGFSIRDGYFMHPFHRRAFDPGELKAHFFRMQMIPALEAHNEELRAEVARLWLRPSSSPARDTGPRPPGALPCPL